MVVVALVVFLFIAAVENLLPLRAEAERATVAATIGSLQSALGMESIRRVMARDDETLNTMAGANPMEWLAVKPSTYSGVIDSVDDVARGHWGFLANGTLFYRVRYPEYFEGGFMEPPGLRFRVVAERSASGNLRGVELEQLDAGDWTTDGSEIGRLLGEGQ
ncbi:MAG TPA: hypothetical protein VF275_07320 [Gammaproteobacteria bacterium]